MKSIFYPLTPDSTIDCQQLCKNIQQLILDSTKDSNESKILNITIGSVIELDNKLYLENK